MAGDIKGKYATSTPFTVSGLHAISSSQTWTGGWSSAPVNNTSALALDYFITQKYFTSSTTRQLGEIRAYLYTPLVLDGPTWANTLFSSGSEGAEGAVTCIDVEQRDGAMSILSIHPVDDGASETYSVGARSVVAVLGSAMPPPYFCLYVSMNPTGGTNAALTGSSSALHYLPILAQYT